MRYLVGCFLTAILLCIYTFSYAQSGYTVKGEIATANNLPAEGATVTLLNYPDSSAVKSTVCNKLGNFEFGRVNPGNYLLQVYKIGYSKFYSAVYHLTNADVTVNGITLMPKANELKEVTITDKRDYIETLPNKTILNVDKSILAAGSSVFDILSTAPGVRVVQEGVYLKGGQKALIAINGKAIGQLNDEQLSELLKSYQSSMISQIEIINNPSAKYDAAGGGVINIILKKSKDYGFKANITESAAFGQDYKLSTGINLNYRTSRFNFFGSYSFADNKVPRIFDVDRIIGQTELNANYTGTTFSKNNNFTAGTDYSISPKQTVGVLMYGYYNQLGIDKNNITYIKNNNVLDSDITTLSHINRAITNLNYNLNYKGSFGKTDNTTLSADFDYSTYRRNSSELLENDFFNPNGTTYSNPLFYSDNSPSQINVRSEKIDFSQALSKTGLLSVGLKNSQVNSDNKIDFAQSSAIDSTFTDVPTLTDHFVYNERINAAYVNYDDKFNNTILALGLRGEQTSSSAESLNPNKTVVRSYFDLFPNLEITQPIDKDNNLILDYNRRITRPNYQDLNPFVAYIDQYSYSTGNTFLKPEYINTYQVSDILKDKYKFALMMIDTKDFFVPVFIQDDATKIYTSTTNNIGNRYEYSAEVTLPVDITKWWSANVYLYGSFERFVYNLDSARKSTTDFEVQVTQNFTITNTIKAELFNGWESPTYYGIKQYTTEWISKVGISKSILDNNGSIKLAVSDIFNSEKYRYTSQYSNLDLTGLEKSGSRFVTATFTYRFGKLSVKTNPKHVSGSTDEQHRLSGSSNEN
jgi:iron complex outermembrane recepter protein